MEALRRGMSWARRRAPPAWLAVIPSCVGAAILATWPLAAHPATTIPLGSEEPATVGVFSIWTLWWTADRLTHGFAHYWDAPFFYPNAGVFTYSEPEPLTGLLVAPLWALGTPPALIHNLALLILLTLNGLFAYRVVRALEQGAAVALIAAILMVTLPFVAKEYGVLNLTPVFGLLWTLEGLMRFARTGTTGAAIWAALGYVAAYLTCQQYALLFAPFAALAALVALGAQRGRRGAILRLAGAGAGAAVVILAVAWPAIRYHQDLGLTRASGVVAELSARPADFGTRPGTAWLPVPPRDFADTAGLFPGALLLGLAALGGAWGWREPALRRWIGYFAGLAGGAGILALGLNLDLGGWQPFATLRVLIPAYAELRSPYRFAVLLQLALPILAAMGLSHAGGTGRPRWVPLLAGLGVLAAIENLTLPVPLAAVPRQPGTAWTAWLRAQPPGSVIAHVPFPAGLRVADYESEAWRLFAQIDHHQPLVNGYSGYFPPGYTAFQQDMAAHFPERGLLCQLGLGLDVNTLVVDQPWQADHAAALAAQRPFLQPLYADAEVAIYRLHMAEADCPVQPGRPGP